MNHRCRGRFAPRRSTGRPEKTLGPASARRSAVSRTRWLPSTRMRKSSSASVSNHCARRRSIDVNTIVRPFGAMSPGNSSCFGVWVSRRRSSRLQPATGRAARRGRLRRGASESRGTWSPRPGAPRISAANPRASHTGDTRRTRTRWVPSTGVDALSGNRSTGLLRRRRLSGSGERGVPCGIHQSERRFNR
jgi:hypothetical protein